MMNRLPFSQHMSDTIRNHFVACCGEFVGTVLFLFFALGGTQVANNIPSSSGDTVVSILMVVKGLVFLGVSSGF